MTTHSMPPTDSLEKGREIPHGNANYVLGERLATSRHMDVWRATSPARDEVVIKFARDKEGATRCEREWEIAALLQGSRYQPRVVGFGSFAGLPMLIRAYVTGETLRERLEKRGPVHARDAVPQLVLIAKELELLHKHQIVHGDLKPENILLPTSFAARVWLIDLGHATSIDRGTRDTYGQWIGGTQFYLAPELRRGAPPTFQSDLFALGVILHELITGQTPLLVPERSLPALHGLLNRHEVPPALEALFHAMVSPEPAQRPPSARALTERLSEVPMPASTGRILRERLAPASESEQKYQPGVIDACRHLRGARRSGVGSLDAAHKALLVLEEILKDRLDRYLASSRGPALLERLPTQKQMKGADDAAMVPRRIVVHHLTKQGQAASPPLNVGPLVSVFRPEPFADAAGADLRDELGVAMGVPWRAPDVAADLQDAGFTRNVVAHEPDYKAGRGPPIGTRWIRCEAVGSVRVTAEGLERLERLLCTVVSRAPSSCVVDDALAESATAERPFDLPGHWPNFDAEPPLSWSECVERWDAHDLSDHTLRSTIAALDDPAHKVEAARRLHGERGGISALDEMKVLDILAWATVDDRERATLLDEYVRVVTRLQPERALDRAIRAFECDPTLGRWGRVMRSTNSLKVSGARASVARRLASLHEDVFAKFSRDLQVQAREDICKLLDAGGGSYEAARTREAVCWLRDMAPPHDAFDRVARDYVRYGTPEDEVRLALRRAGACRDATTAIPILERLLRRRMEVGAASFPMARECFDTWTRWVVATPHLQLPAALGDAAFLEELLASCVRSERWSDAVSLARHVASSWRGDCDVGRVRSLLEVLSHTLPLDHRVLIYEVIEPLVPSRSRYLRSMLGDWVFSPAVPVVLSAAIVGRYLAIVDRLVHDKDSRQRFADVLQLFQQRTDLDASTRAQVRRHAAVVRQLLRHDTLAVAWDRVSNSLDQSAWPIVVVVVSMVAVPVVMVVRDTMNMFDRSRGARVLSAGVSRTESALRQTAPARGADASVEAARPTPASALPSHIAQTCARQTCRVPHGFIAELPGRELREFTLHYAECGCCDAARLAYQRLIVTRGPVLGEDPYAAAVQRCRPMPSR